MSTNFNPTDSISDEEFAEIQYIFYKGHVKKFRDLMGASIKPCMEEVKESKRTKTVVDARKMAKTTIALIVSIALAIGIKITVDKATRIYRDIKAEKVVSELADAGVIEKPNDFAFSIVSGGTHYTAYDTSGIAKRTINYQGSYDLDAIIYCYYVSFDYNVVNQMNSLFSDMHMYIEAKLNQGEEVSPEVLATCNYKDFYAYLEAKGFKSIDEYKASMDKLLCAYGIADETERMDKVSSILAQLDEQEQRSQGGRL